MSNIPITSLPPVIELTGLEDIPLVQAGTTKRATAQQIANQFGNNFPAAIEYEIDGGVSTTISSGVKGYIEVPFDCRIISGIIVANTIGSITVDVWRCTFAQFDAGATHPVLADSITNSNPLQITLSTKTNNACAGWTVDLDQGDIIAFVPSACVNINHITAVLNIDRTF